MVCTDRQKSQHTRAGTSPTNSIKLNGTDCLQLGDRTSLLSVCVYCCYLNMFGCFRSLCAELWIKSCLNQQVAQRRLLQKRLHAWKTPADTHTVWAARALMVIAVSTTAITTRAVTVVAQAKRTRACACISLAVHCRLRQMLQDTMPADAASHYRRLQAQYREALMPNIEPASICNADRLTRGKFMTPGVCAANIR